MSKPDEEHPLQYAFVLGTVLYPHDPVLYGTEKMQDAQVFAELAGRGKDSLGRAIIHQARHQLRYARGYWLRTERYSRCPSCEQWSPCDVRKALEAEKCAGCLTRLPTRPGTWPRQAPSTQSSR